MTLDDQIEIPIKEAKEKLLNLEKHLPNESYQVKALAQCLGESLKVDENGPDKLTPQLYAETAEQILREFRKDIGGPNDEAFYAYLFTRCQVQAAALSCSVYYLARELFSKKFEEHVRPNYRPDAMDMTIAHFMAQAS